MTVTKTKTVTPGSDVTWSVSATGFDTQSGTINDITASQTLDVYLLGSYGTIDKVVKDVQAINYGYTTWMLLTDGTLWGCGYNAGGQQGSGNTSNVTSFTQRLTGVKQISVSGDTTWALKTDGTLWGCGYGNYGQQGSGNTTDVTTFTQRLTGVKNVFCSNNTTWALKTDGTLWGTGWNIYGQQGSGTSGSGTNVTSFTQRLTDVAQVSCSLGSTWALKTDGTVWGCGDNDYGQQGSGDTNAVTTFTQRLTDVGQISASANTTWALKTDGTLWGCGRNNSGQQGSGDTTDVTTFTQRLTDVAQISVSGETTWALKTDGTVWGCGYNYHGQQGNETSGSSTKVLTFTQRLSDVSEINACEDTTWALKTDGTLWGCGYGNYGQQGSGGTTDVTTFTQRLTDVKQFNACRETTWALKTDGTVWGCGYGNYGQQGNGGSGNTNKVTSFTKRNPSVTGYNSATLTIVPTPSDAIVTINTVVTSSADIRKGTEAAWSVSKTGYVTQSGSIAHIYDDTTLEITLESE